MIDIKEENVVVQKSSPNGLFSSKQYVVPANKVFPVLSPLKIQTKEVTGPADLLSQSSDSDDSSTVYDEEESPPITQDVVERPPSVQRRSGRNRPKPQRYGVVSDSDQLSDNENDLIPSWYPGWDKERTKDYVNRNTNE